MCEFYQQLCHTLGTESVRLNEPMDRHTTFRAGGKAACFVMPKNEEALKTALTMCRTENTPFYILGNGSNLLVSDKGYNGVILSMAGAWNYSVADDDVITAGAGALLSHIAGIALKSSLTGFEFAAGIPGTIGGAVVMNAGAYGGELKQVLKCVKVMTADGSVKTLYREELELGYRTSCILKKGYIVLEAQIQLKNGRKEEIKAYMDHLADQRRQKQPLEYPSAGSTFKRPAGHFAGKLIEDAGLRGYQVGGAQVSEKHCGFVINTGGATAADIINLCNDVKRKVRESFDVELELEVKTLGDF